MISHLKARILLKTSGPALTWRKALRENDESLAQYLYDLRVPCSDDNRQEWYYWATKDTNMYSSKKMNVLRLALQSGLSANPISSHNYWDYFLHCVANRGCLESVKMLVEHGADLELRNQNNLTPLFEALEPFTDQPYSVNNSLCERKEVLLYLLSQGANVSALQGEFQKSILSEGVDNVDVLKALIKAGVSLSWDVYADAAGPNKPLELVRIYQDHFIFSLSKKHPKYWGLYLSLLKQHGQDHTTTNDHEENFLFHCLKTLGADQKNPLKGTAQNVLHVLGGFGYDTDHINKNGDTVWHVLFKNYHSQTSAFVEALKHTSAQNVLHHPNNQGQTPMDLLNNPHLKCFEQDILKHKAFIEKDLLCKNVDVRKSCKTKRKL